jgi:uncharacterized protein
LDDRGVRAPARPVLAGTVQRDVAFEADGYLPESGEAWSVVVKGRGEAITRGHELLDTADLPLFPWHAAPKQRFVRIVPDEVTGRRFRVDEREAWQTPLAEAPRSAPE